MLGFIFGTATWLERQIRNFCAESCSASLSRPTRGGGAIPHSNARQENSFASEQQTKGQRLASISQGFVPANIQSSNFPRWRYFGTSRTHGGTEVHATFLMEECNRLPRTVGGLSTL
jgi:hypothetical protein